LQSKKKEVLASKKGGKTIYSREKGGETRKEGFIQPESKKKGSVVAAEKKKKKGGGGVPARLFFLRKEEGSFLITRLGGGRGRNISPQLQKKRGKPP